MRIPMIAENIISLQNLKQFNIKNPCKIIQGVCASYSDM